MRSFALLPLDNRPCNVYFPKALAKEAGVSLCLPDPKILGDFRKPAHFQSLSQWAENTWPQSEKIILSLDTWVYGGLISSRKEKKPLALFLERLNQIKDFKAQHPTVTFSGFITLLRISDSHDDTEEQPYWKDFGREIYRYSHLEHCLENTSNGTSETPSTSEMEKEFADLKAKVPADIVTHYKELRARNFKILEETLNLAAEGFFERVYVGCDDGAQFGWNVQEKQRLTELIVEKKLAQKVLLYPGADELACTLLAQAIYPEETPIQVKYSHPESKSIVTRYEGIPLNETLVYQAKAAGIKIETNKTLPTLWIHNPENVPQTDQFLDRETRVAEQVDIFKILSETLKTTSDFALADIVYANGADNALLEYLEKNQMLPQLDSYGAWNTTGNTLGFVLAWFKIHLNSEKQKQSAPLFLLERLLDDGYYQGFLRQELCNHYTDPITLDTCLTGMSLLNKKLKDWSPQFNNVTIQVKHFSFPWKRFFETDLRVCAPNL